MTNKTYAEKSALTKMLLTLTYSWYNKDKIVFDITQEGCDMLQFVIKRIFNIQTWLPLPLFKLDHSLIYVSVAMIHDITTALIEPEKMTQFAKDYDPRLSYLPDAMEKGFRDTMNPYLAENITTDPSPYKDIHDLFFVAGIRDSILNNVFADLLFRDFVTRLLDNSHNEVIKGNFKFLKFRAAHTAKDEHMKKSATIEMLFSGGQDRNLLKSATLKLPFFMNSGILDQHERLELTQDLIGQLVSFYASELILLP